MRPPLSAQCLSCSKKISRCRSALLLSCWFPGSSIAWWCTDTSPGVRPSVQEFVRAFALTPRLNIMTYFFSRTSFALSYWSSKSPIFIRFFFRQPLQTTPLSKWFYDLRFPHYMSATCPDPACGCCKLTSATTMWRAGAIKHDKHDCKIMFYFFHQFGLGLMSSCCVSWGNAFW